MCDCFVPLHVHSYYSLLDGLPSPRKIAERAKEIGAPAIAITDHGSIFGIVDHFKQCKKLGIKPIGGIELYMCKHDPSIKDKTNNKRNHLTVIAKNASGIETLMSLVSETNRPDWFYRKPRIDLKNLKRFASKGDLICLSGCLAGELSTSLFTSEEIIINGTKYDGVGAACYYGADISQIDEAKKLLISNWRDVAEQVVRKYQSAFGIDNFYIELQDEGMVAQKIVVECLREVAAALDVKSVATLDAHYTCKSDYDDHIILLCSQMHTTIEEQERMKKAGGDTMVFFYLDQFYIFDYEEMQNHYTQQEIEMSLEIADRIEESSIGRQPCLPRFDNEETKEKNMSSNTYIEFLCIEEAKNKLKDLTKEDKVKYWDRLKHELAVIREADLADYFLIVMDACKFVDSHNGPRGKGRGSGAGSLVNYLLGITGIDPLEYGLYFERFYNASRNIPPHFNFSEQSFMEWYSDNFEKLQHMNIQDARHQLVTMASKTGRKTIRLKQEAKWIDDNNPRMWLYLSCNAFIREENPSNSHIAWATGMTDKIDLDKEVQIHSGHISLPDIDIDIGVKFRSKVIEYLKQRWGEQHVAQMITFGRLQGKAALKEVFRVRKKDVEHLMKVKAIKEGKNPKTIDLAPFDLCNEITKYIPDEAAIADELQEIREAENDPDYGILKWSIHNVDEVIEAYKWYKPLFDQAMRIEGTKKSQSRHAAGVVIADKPIKDLVPMAYDAKTKDQVVGVEMADAEAMGAVKFDFLGVTALDKLWFAQELINKRIESE